MNFIDNPSITISGYLESLFTKHSENSSGITNVSSLPTLDGYYSNVIGNSGTNLVASSGVSARIYLDTINNSNVFGSSFRGRRFRGDLTNQSGILKDDVLLQLVGDGYISGVGVKNATVSIAYRVGENWISGSNPTYIEIYTTPISGTQQIKRLHLSSEGLFGINNFNPEYALDISGAGNFTQGVFNNGILLATTGDLFNVSGVLDSKIVGGMGLTQLVADTLYYSILNPNNFINLSNLNGLISSGAGDLRYYNISNIENFIKSGEVIGTFVNKNETGAFLSLNSLIGFTNSGNLEATGISLQNQIVSIKNGTGNFIQNNSLNGLSTTGYVNLVSGSLNEKIGAGGLTQGQADLLYASINNLAATGSNLQVQINNLNVGSVNISGEISGNLGLTNSYGMGFKKTARNIINNSNILMDITGLNFYANPNDTYGFEAYIPFMSNTATCGLTLNVSGPTGIGATGMWSSEIMLTPVAGTDAYQSIGRMATPTVSGLHTTASVALINHPHFARLMGHWVCDNNSGVVQVRFASEVNGNQSTILRGAWLKYF